MFHIRVVTQKNNMKRVFNLIVHKSSIILFFVDVLLSDGSAKLLQTRSGGPTGL